LQSAFGAFGRVVVIPPGAGALGLRGPSEHHPDRLAAAAVGAAIPLGLGVLEQILQVLQLLHALADGARPLEASAFAGDRAKARVVGLAGRDDLAFSSSISPEDRRRSSCCRGSSLALTPIQSRQPIEEIDVT
jgi:hypothetical protein